MVEIDRMAILLKPKAPFVEWLQKVDEEKQLTKEILVANCTVLLVPVIDDEWALQQYIQTSARYLFEKELEAWCLDDSLWPDVRDYNAFLRHFDVEVHDFVLDNVSSDYDENLEVVTLQ